MSKSTDFLPLLKTLQRSTISGERVADKLEMTRTAIWKKIRTLQGMGFPVQTHARRGYRFNGVADFSLAQLKFKGALAHWAKPHYELSTDSTQKLALQAAQNAVPEGHFWIAEIQHAGRGRLEREWSSAFGGLWFSLVLRPQVPPSRAASIGLVAALDWVHTLEKVANVKARLKWPNDIVVGKPLKKAAGFLTQMSGEMDRTDWIVLGMGINVFNEIPPELADKATTLFHVGAGHRPRPPLPLRARTVPYPYNRAALLTEFLQRFYASYRLWQRAGFQAFQSDYWAHYARPNQSCILKTAGGLIRGIAQGVDASGALLLKSRGKLLPIHEGETIR